MTDSLQHFRLPDVGEGLTEADIVQWLVQPGDEVKVNQAIVEIETAKSLVELPSPYDGVVVELLFAEGDTVEVGVPIITIGPAGSEVIKDGASSPGADAAASGAAAGAGSQETSSAEEDTGAGDPPEADQGSDMLVGYGPKAGGSSRRRRRMTTSAGGAAPAAKAAEPAASEAVEPAVRDVPPPPAPVAPAEVTPSQSARVLAKPPVRKLARDLGIDLSAVWGTGPGGIITREDVVQASEKTERRSMALWPGDDQPWLDSGTVSPDGRQTRVPVRSVRKRTAEAMVTSAFTAPHVTVFHTLDVTKTMDLVARLREDREFADVRISPLLIVAKALLLAVRRHPEINAAWDDETQEIIYKHYVNLGIAASTPRGLVVPNIKDAHRMTLHEIAVELGELVSAARAGKTTPAAMSDGTITITNVGVFGIDSGTPILNPGESAILAFGAVREKPWVHEGEVKPRWVTQLALSFDHRLVDGELGTRVLADVATILEEPGQALVWG
ncbi:MAG TPA: dihydrolipoamide acetyltransferase family protein [Actinomycetales bacterium]|nr:dihydrolipoamide acetyltransferase family protein [Actinomycetales bacterium]